MQISYRGQEFREILLKAEQRHRKHGQRSFRPADKRCWALVVNPTDNLARPAGTAHQTRTSSSLDVMLGRPALLLAVLIDDEERCAGRKNLQGLEELDH